jgi:hypothetical protein
VSVGFRIACDECPEPAHKTITETPVNDNRQVVTKSSDTLYDDFEITRKEYAQKYGLPETASWEEISNHDSGMDEPVEHPRAEKVTKFENGVYSVYYMGDIRRNPPKPIGMSRTFYEDFEITRKEYAQKYGLPETATWSEIQRVNQSVKIQ